MIVCKLQGVPSRVRSGEAFKVRVVVTGVTVGRNCQVSLYRSMPKPDKLLANDKAAADENGTCVFPFEVMLASEGINVLHCEATAPGAFDSDSKGMIVE